MSFGKRKGKLFVISGPSGAGKGTIVNRVVSETDLQFSVSMTTREPREGEIDGVHYFFVNEEEFKKTIKDNGFLEHADIYGNHYGTPKTQVLERLDNGIDIILDIEMQGALQVRENYPDGVFIFILPPSLTELRKRLTNRGTETPEKIEIRLGHTLKEMEYLDKYDYLVINDDLDTAVNEVKSIITAEHSRISVSAKDVIEEYIK